MTLLHCLSTEKDITKAMVIMWTCGFSILAAFFFALFLFGLIPTFRYKIEFHLLPTLNRYTRISFTISLLIKAIGHLSAMLVGRYLPNSPKHGELLSVAGLCLLEFPAYVISTCYTMVLMYWLSACLQILPHRYVKIFRRTKSVLIGYNCFIYLLFVSTIIVAALYLDKPHDFKNYYIGSVVIVRDFLLCLVFVVFVINLRIGLREDKYKEDETIDEKKLFWCTIILSIFLLIRGFFALVQGVWFMNEEKECQPGFFVWEVLNEVLIEGLPLAFLIHINNDFLFKQRMISFELNPAALGTADN